MDNANRETLRIWAIGTALGALAGLLIEGTRILLGR